MASSQPNIIFILIDDLGWRDLNCYGSTFYETPNLDRLAERGMLFTDAYASCPVCSPTRASVQTGRYPARVGVTNFLTGRARGRLVEPEYIDHMPLEEYTIAQALGDAGYQTWHVGKWHLGGEERYWPHNRGYDVNVAGCAKGMPNNGYFSPWKIPMLEDGPEGEYLTDRLTDEAIDLVENAGDRPFFLHMSYYTVHVPIQGRPDHVARFREKAASLKLDQIEPFVEGEHFACEHKRDQRLQRRMLQTDPEYAAMVWSMDENIGRLLQAVEDAGQADNTIVFFTSDNGGLATAEGAPTCNFPLHEGKGWMYEGGTREPLIVHWPGVTEPGSRCAEPVTTPDFYPTMLQMAGAELIPEQHVDGASLVPLLQGADGLDRETIYWHYPHYGNQGGTPGCSMRSGDWKLIEFFEDGRLELYNLREDVGETRNRADEMPDLAQGMLRMLQAWRAEIGADLPTPNPEWGG
ncbi:MAG: sulfatase [Armatimonadota bacterium]|jgi:arylsulfatase A-like enzyme